MAKFDDVGRAGAIQPFACLLAPCPFATRTSGGAIARIAIRRLSVPAGKLPVVLQIGLQKKPTTYYSDYGADHDIDHPYIARSLRAERERQRKRNTGLNRHDRANPEGRSEHHWKEHANSHRRNWIWNVLCDLPDHDGRRHSETETPRVLALPGDARSQGNDYNNRGKQWVRVVKEFLCYHPHQQCSNRRSRHLTPCASPPVVQNRALMHLQSLFWMTTSLRPPGGFAGAGFTLTTAFTNFLTAHQRCVDR
jgi:hypothetical protein